LTKSSKRKSRLYAGILVIGLVLGVVLALGLAGFIPDNSVPELMLLRDTGGGCCVMHNVKVGGTIASRFGGMLMKVGGTASASSPNGPQLGRHTNGQYLSLIGVTVSNSSAMAVKGLVVNENMDGVTLPVLVTQEAYYVLVSSQTIPVNAYVSVTGLLTVYWASPYNNANDCSPFDCSNLLLQIQVSQFTVLYQGS